MSETKGSAPSVWVAPKQAAARLNISVGVVRKMIRDGRLRPHRLRGTRLLRLRVEDVDALLQPVEAFGGGQMTCRGPIVGHDNATPDVGTRGP
jgi:excisionase family DNA binding protein